MISNIVMILECTDLAVSIIVDNVPIAQKLGIMLVIISTEQNINMPCSSIIWE